MTKILGLLILAVIVVIPAYAQEYPELGVRVETVHEDLNIPWSIDWLPNGDMLFTERDGALRIVQNGTLQEMPLLEQNVAGIEGGMLGVTVDPRFSENNFIYLYYTYSEFVSTFNKVVRYHLGDTIVEDRVLIDGIPGGPFHDGGRIAFGPDGKLYITTGDAGDPNLSQDINSLAGKILRINPDGTIPDNPWDSPVYSIGHRNPQGLDWDIHENLIATEHGPSGFESGHDEINHIVAGANYGWPHIVGDETREGLQNPIFHTGNVAWAPSGAEFYDGKKIPQWSNKYFVATLRGSHLHMFDLQNNTISKHERLFQDDFGRLRDIQTGPDGYLYMLTSNKDGRGFADAHDDKILRIVPLDECKVESVNAKSSTVGNTTTVSISGCTHESEVHLDITDKDGKVVYSGVISQESGKFKETIVKENLEETVWTVTVDGDVIDMVVVPEFGSIAMLILVSSIVLVVVSTRLYR